MPNRWNGNIKTQPVDAQSIINRKKAKTKTLCIKTGKRIIAKQQNITFMTKYAIN
jgi:hypothetical protein